MVMRTRCPAGTRAADHWQLASLEYSFGAANFIKPKSSSVESN